MPPSISGNAASRRNAAPGRLEPADAMSRAAVGQVARAMADSAAGRAGQARPDAPRFSQEQALTMHDTDTPFERGLAVIQAFDPHGLPLSVSEIGQKTGIPRASVARCLYTLQQLGFVRQSADKRFGLTPKILTLGFDAFASVPLPRAAQAVLNHLAEQTGESCVLLVLDRGEMLCLAEANGDFLHHSRFATGARAPMTCTASGRVILSELEPAARDALLDAPLQRHTPHTVVDRPALLRLLQAVRAQGYAWCDQEFELGLCTLAVPIRDDRDEAQAALCMHVPACRVAGHELPPRYLEPLQQAAWELSLLLK